MRFSYTQSEEIFGLDSGNLDLETKNLARRAKTAGNARLLLSKPDVLC